MTTQHEHPHKHAHTAGQMAEAAGKWLATLNAEQTVKATFHYMDGERLFWYYPPMNRHGLALRDMDVYQRELALALMSTGLHADANQNAKSIIQHELILGPLEKEEGAVTFVRDPELYYWTVFGDVGGEDPWGWRVEGHHLSLHYSVWGDKVIAVTPIFFGANPAEVRKGPKQGLRFLGGREDLAIKLMASFDAGQRSKAVIHDKAPWDILSFNSSKHALHDEEGLAGSDMNGTQKEILLALISDYISQVPDDVSKARMDSIRDNGLDHFRLVWAGGLDRSRDHYYRIHGRDFIVEFDNIQNGANHIHSVWRDVENDFAQDVLRDHRLLYHVI